MHVPTYRAYDATQAYAVSKLANVLHTKELAVRLQVSSILSVLPCRVDQLAGRQNELKFPLLVDLQEMGADVSVNCVHPGIVRTRLNRDREGLLTGTALANWLLLDEFATVSNYYQNGSGP